MSTRPDGDAPATEWPTAREVAVVIVAAARALGEHPLDAFGGGGTGSHARWFAFAALSERFPSVPHKAMAERVGFKRGRACKNAHANLAWKLRNGLSWWSEATLQVVKAALAAEVEKTHAEWDRAGAASASGLTAPAERAGDESSVDGVGEKQPESPQASTGTTSLPGTEVRADLAPINENVEAEIIPPEPIDPERVARVQRMKAWAAGEPIAPKGVLEGDAADLPPLARTGAAPAKVSSAPKPPASSRRARAKRKPHVPVAQRVAAAQSSVSFGPVGAIDLHYRPDAPAEKRGAVNVTSELMGDPDFHRSALGQRKGTP